MKVWKKSHTLTGASFAGFAGFEAFLVALESLGTAAFLSDLAIFVRRMEGGWRRSEGTLESEEKLLFSVR